MLKFDNVNIKVAKTFKDRLIGLMFRKKIDYGLLFKRCRSIHTFFMRDAIDVIATDKKDNIVKTYKGVKPWRILIAPKLTKNIYELPKNTLK